MTVSGRGRSGGQQPRAGSGDRDALLAARARAGNAQAADTLITRFERQAFAIASDYFILGADRDDLQQEARIGIFKAARDFNPVLGIPFAAFVNLCVHRHVLAAVTTANRKKHQTLTFAGRVTKPDDGGDAFDALDVVEAPTNADAAEILADRERAFLILTVVRDRLTELERAALLGHADGETYVDTARRLGLPVRARSDRYSVRSKSIDNALERGRRKIRLALADADSIALGAAA